MLPLQKKYMEANSSMFHIQSVWEELGMFEGKNARQL